MYLSGLKSDPMNSDERELPKLLNRSNWKRGRREAASFCLVVI